MTSDTAKRSLLITLSGPAGSGKSHCAAALAEAFGLPRHSAGSIFRRIAEERGVSIEELTKMAEDDEGIDREIDRRSEELAKGGGVILEGRLVAFFSPPDKRALSFYLTAPFEERVRRIADREGISIAEARRRTLAREKGERRRYRKIYGIDIDDLSRYDFVINTSKWCKECVAELLREIVALYIKTRG